MSDPWVTCVVKAEDVAKQTAWLHEHRKSIVARRANGDVVVRFRASELKKVSE